MPALYTVAPLACGPGYPELSKSYMDMASKLFTFTFTFTVASIAPLWLCMQLLCICSALGTGGQTTARTLTGVWIDPR